MHPFGGCCKFAFIYKVVPEGPLVILRLYSHYTGYLFVLSQNLSGIVGTPILYVTLCFRDWHGVMAQLCSITEIMPNFPFLCVNRTLIWYMVLCQHNSYPVQCDHNQSQNSYDSPTVSILRNTIMCSALVPSNFNKCTKVKRFCHFCLFCSYLETARLFKGFFKSGKIKSQTRKYI